MSHSRAVHAGLAVCVTALTLLLGACGQRGALYIPGKPGDPYFDRQNRGTVPAQPATTSTPDSTKPAPKRDGEGNQ